MKPFKLADAYGQFYTLLDSAESEKSLYNTIDFKGTKISEDLFFQLCKIQYFGWKHRIKYKRSIKSSISDVFQDIVAYYLKMYLPKEFDITLEEKREKIRPDIIIKKGDKNYFAIEIKTTIGYGRINSKKKETFTPYNKRVKLIAQKFHISPKNILFILAGVNNNGTNFPIQYWDNDTKERKPRPAKFPYNIIYPLFDLYDPYYWKEYEEYRKERVNEYPHISDKKIREMARENIVTPFEEVLKVIIKK